MGSSVFNSAVSGLKIRIITGNTEFTTPTWLRYPCVSVAGAPEIDVQQPLKTSLVDGTAKKRYGTLVVGQSGTPKTYTIKNTGNGNLTGLAVSVDGTNAGDFQITPPVDTSLIPGAKTTFTVPSAPRPVAHAAPLFTSIATMKTKTRSTSRSPGAEECIDA